MKLSDHFSLIEFTTSQTAARLGIDNSPSLPILGNLRETAAMMEKVRRDLKNNIITVTSGYRCLEVNRAIGSGDGSAHVRGMAVDFICPGFGTPLEICRRIAASDIAFDQLIWEFGSWCHIGRSPGMPRRQLLVIDNTGTRDVTDEGFP